MAFDRYSYFRSPLLPISGLLSTLLLQDKHALGTLVEACSGHLPLQSKPTVGLVSCLSTYALEMTYRPGIVPCAGCLFRQHSSPVEFKQKLATMELGWGGGRGRERG